MTEQWLPIPDRPGYEVSNMGRARSVDRIGWDGRKLRGRILMFGYNSNGRPFIIPRVAGESRLKYVHVAVLEAFIGPRPPGMVVRHLDGNPRNNQVGNLAWGTQSQNRLDTVAHKTDPNARKTHCRRGHELSGENVRLRNSAVGRSRQCVACHRGMATAAYWAIPVDDAADDHYERLRGR